MSQLPRVASFQDLVVYRKAREFSHEIFLLTRSFPKEETYSLIDQVRRSSRAIGANLAEAWAKRRYEKHFISKLTDADGEQQETQHWIGIALDCGYLDAVQAEQLVSKCKEIGRMLGGMIERADTFWDESKSLHESSAENFVDDTDSLSY
jgi:four helix bundle protein